MLDTKRLTSIAALVGALALTTAMPAFAADAAPAADAAAAAAPAADAAAPATPAVPGKKPHISVTSMFIDAATPVKTVMIGLMLSSVFSWVLLITKLMEFSRLNKGSDRFLEGFRGAKSIADIYKIASSEENEGNPMADMAASATHEIELSRQAGLQVTGEHRDSTLHRAGLAVNAVQASLSKRLSSGMTFLASVGSSGPFIGLFGTVYGIMISFIGIAESGTTNLASVAPGISEALLATGIGLFAAIPSVIFYNFFQTRIGAYGVRTEGFVAELMNTLSRQLDKGA
ncbi:MAG: MotA/TolQ/ExbB proton channel [Caulobacteraceae bacterium]|nr:MotA/TolQ/ExbB proton channel [Caulobacteraceae bacterium]